MFKRITHDSKKGQLHVILSVSGGKIPIHKNLPCLSNVGNNICSSKEVLPFQVLIYFNQSISFVLIVSITILRKI